MFRYMLLILSFLTVSAHKTSEIDLPRNEVKKLEQIIDGTSFLADGQMIKLWGIQAIEADSPFAYASKLYLETILNEAPFHCEIVKRMSTHMIMKCYSDGVDIASMLLHQGLAYTDKADSYKPYVEIEAASRASSLGVWGYSKKSKP